MKDYKFTFTRSVSSTHSYNLEFMTDFAEQLKNAGFTSIQVTYPKLNTQIKNPPKVRPEVLKNFGKKVPISKYLEHKVDYPRIIVTAVNERRKAELKIFFISSGSSFYFDDEDYIYMNQQSSGSNAIMIKADDPIDGKGLIQFVYDLLNNSSVFKNQILSIMTFVGVLFILAELGSIFSKEQQHDFLFVHNYGWHPGIELVGIIIFISAIFINSRRPPAGLHISPPKEKKVTTLMTDLVSGKHNRNVIVYVVLGVFTIVLGQLSWEIVVKPLLNLPR